MKIVRTFDLSSFQHIEVNDSGWFPIAQRIPRR
jgi:hypothetical protein